jgi:hypothetical protein
VRGNSWWEFNGEAKESLFPHLSLREKGKRREIFSALT